MKLHGRTFVITFLVIQCVTILSVAKDFDFFYFVQQWPASYCDSRRGCCYPKTGKPEEDFSIHGLWPNYIDGTYPSNCDSSNPFDDSKVSNLESVLQKHWPTLACPSGDGLKFWRHEWEKHGTCAESVFDESGYFEAALSLKKKANLLNALKNAGIKPADGKFHTLGQIKDAITKGVGYAPFIECNVDSTAVADLELRSRGGRKFFPPIVRRGRLNFSVKIALLNEKNGGNRIKLHYCAKNPGGPRLCSTGNHQIYQVYQCVDASATNFIECPVFPHGRPCGNKVELPSFSSASSRDEL